MENTTIGNAIRAVRNDMGISLDTAAHLTGVSKAMLGQIERGESTPTVSTMWKISTGLKITLSRFFNGSGSVSSMVSLSDIETAYSEEGAMRVKNVFPFDPLTGFDFLYIEMDKGCVHFSEAHANVSNEYILVIEGTLDMTVAGECYVLNEGCAFSFDGTVDHSYANAGDKKLIFHNIVKYM